MKFKILKKKLITFLVLLQAINQKENYCILKRNKFQRYFLLDINFFTIHFDQRKKAKFIFYSQNFFFLRRYACDLIDIS